MLFISMFFFILVYGISCIFKPHSKKRALNLRENYLRFVAIPLLNIKVTKIGHPISEPCLYVCNHRSFTDPIVLCKYLQAFVIAKAEVAHYPIINKGAELTGVIWVNREEKESRNHTRTKMVESILNGYNILVYPEGTVSIDKSPLPFKKGTFMEAAANNITVVPVCIEYKSKNDMWLIHDFVPQFLFQYAKWKTEVKLTFGPPLPKVTGEELHSMAYNWINTELHRQQKGWSHYFRD